LRIGLVIVEGREVLVAADAEGRPVDLGAMAEKELGMRIPRDPVELAMDPDALASLDPLLDPEEGVAERYRTPQPDRWLPPFRRPSKVLALAWNYRAHAEEGGREVPAEPVFFAKAPSCLIGHGECIVVPEGIGRVDPEVELAVVLGRRARAVSAQEAYDYVAGYTVFNDVTARDLQRGDIQEGRPWFRAKSLDTFGPVGPWLVTSDEVGDPHGLTLELEVNGKLRQSASTADMLFSVPELVEYISQYITLCPGDVIATGTPAGIAPVRPGDEVVCRVEGIGTLINSVVSAG